MNVDENISGAYNGFWKLYKNFLASHDMEAYNNGIARLMKSYPTTFTQSLCMTWAPVIQKEMEDYAKSKEE